MKEPSNQQQVTKAKTIKPKKKKEMEVWERVQLLQRKLYLKAKQEKGYKRNNTLSQKNLVYIF